MQSSLWYILLTNIQNVSFLSATPCLTPACVVLCVFTTDGVGVQNHFNYDWTEDPAAEAQGSQREKRKIWMSALCPYVCKQASLREANSLCLEMTDICMTVDRIVPWWLDWMPVFCSDCLMDDATENVAYKKIGKDQWDFSVLYLMIIFFTCGEGIKTFLWLNSCRGSFEHFDDVSRGHNFYELRRWGKIRSPLV